MSSQTAGHCGPQTRGPRRSSEHGATMDEQDSNTWPNEQGAFELTRRTVIETGTTALLLTALPRATFAAGAVDDDGPPPPAVAVELRINGRLHSLALDPRTTLLD